MRFAFSTAPQLCTWDEVLPVWQTADQIERQHAAKIAHLLLGERVPWILRQTRIVHALDLRLCGQELGDRLGVLRRIDPRDPDLRRAGVQGDGHRDRGCRPRRAAHAGGAGADRRAPRVSIGGAVEQ